MVAQFAANLLKIIHLYTTVAKFYVNYSFKKVVFKRMSYTILSGQKFLTG